MITDYIRLALNNLRERRVRSWLTMIGIFIGIAAVVSLIGLGEGLRGAILGQFGFLGPDVISVQAGGVGFGAPGQGVVTPLSDELYEKIERINGVDVAFNRLLQPATVEFNDIQQVEFTASVPEGDNRRVFEQIININADDGRTLKDGDNRKAFMGYEFSQPGNGYDRAMEVGDRFTINDETFEVVGFLERKGSFILDGSILLNEEVMLDLFGDDDTTDIIAVKVDSVDQVPGVREDIERLLRKERDVDEGEENFQVQSPENALETLNDTLFAIQIFVSLIAFISLLVGGIGIMNTMYTAVLERTKEIGIMKSIGATNRTIFTLFFIESGFIGMIGGIVGVLLGSTLAYSVAFIGAQVLGSDLIRAQINPSLIILSLIFSFIIGTVFGVLPAIRAAKLQPVNALRSK